MAATAKVQVGGGGHQGPNVFTGAADPTVLNDVNDGVSLGDTFINTTSKTAFTCVDNSAGAASWKQSTN